MVYRPNVKRTYAAGSAVMWQECYNHPSPADDTSLGPIAEVQVSALHLKYLLVGQLAGIYVSAGNIRLDFRVMACHEGERSEVRTF